MQKQPESKKRIQIFTHLRKDILQIHPRMPILTILHILAMNFPVHGIRSSLYRLRGTKIGKNVFFAPQVFLEEAYPSLITIEDNTDIGPRVMILTHDTIWHHLKPGKSIFTDPVIIEKNCYIGGGSIILPGVVIGAGSIIGSGSVVTKSIPPGSVAMGVPARVVCSTNDWLRKYLVSP